MFPKSERGPAKDKQITQDVHPHASTDSGPIARDTDLIANAGALAKTTATLGEGRRW